MTIGTVGLAGLGLASIFAVLDWVAVYRGDARLERRAKPAVMGVLIAAVLISDPNASSRSLLLATALATSLAGDWLLLPPVRFVNGLIAFFFAHLAYLGAFLVGPLHLELALVGAVGAVAVLLLAGRAILAGATRAGMRRPVAGYLGAICLMAIAATASGSPAAIAGAWLFVTSDAILGWDRFVAPSPETPRATLTRRLAVIVTYHCAQLLLTAALLAAA
jgi:alkenylglycerophosphocholine/alkenylglycerophosphoethanolamine hydrolase